MAHKRLRHRGVDRIHRHMVAVVRRPPERKLRKIAGSDHHAVFLIRDIHQNLRALPRLTVLIGHIMRRHIMPDVSKMEQHRFLNIDLPKICPQRTDQLYGVIVGAVCRTKARHRHRLDPLMRKPQQIKGAHHNEQRERRIKPAGDSNHCRFAVCVLHTLF